MGVPARAVRGPKITLPPPRFLDEEDYETVLKFAKKCGIYAEVATALWTGMRVGEIKGLTYDAIDCKGRKIVLLKTKTDRPRSIPMKRELIGVLEDHAKADEKKRRPSRGLVFHEGRGRPRTEYWWRYALDPIKARMPVFGKVDGTGSGWHLFRHTFASRLVQAGVSLRKVAEWMGHTSIATTMRYAHLQPAYDSQVENA